MASQSLLRTFLRAAMSAKPFSTSAAASVGAAATSSSGPWADRPTSQRLNRYIVIAPDFTDADALSRRLAVRQFHLEESRAGKRAGRIELGGALLNKDFNEIDAEVGPTPHMMGSALIVVGESIQDVKDRVMQDQYLRGKVWNPEALQIYPFVQAPLATASPVEEAADNSEARAQGNANATLGQLRQDLAAGKGPKIGQDHTCTLLRTTWQMPCTSLCACTWQV